MIPFAEGEARLDWLRLTEALAAGHGLPRAEIGDTFLYRGADTLLTRSAWIDGLGIAVKSATIFPGNPAQGKADGERRGQPLFRPRRHAGGGGRFPPRDQVEDRRRQPAGGAAAGPAGGAARS